MGNLVQWMVKWALGAICLDALRRRRGVSPTCRRDYERRLVQSSKLASVGTMLLILKKLPSLEDNFGIFWSRLFCAPQVEFGRNH